MAQRISQMLAEPRLRHFEEPFQAPPGGRSPLARLIRALAQFRLVSVEQVLERFVAPYQNSTKDPPAVNYRMGESLTKLEELQRAGQQELK